MSGLECGRGPVLSKTRGDRGHDDEAAQIVPQEIVTDEVADGRLRRIMPQWQGSPVTVYAVTETRLLPAKTQRFIEFLRERLSRT
ncbi:hypothetical protein JEY40_10795 [Bradyrhizobium japonicum]|nr:hypothetical protein JEY40_10795 [Bradyrhizobium japonicum]